MIKETELRIGNWVNHLGTATQLLSGAQIDKNHSDLKAIQITPEILEQCGFEKEGNNWDYDFIRLDEDFNCSLENSWAETRDIEIKYLHQLQNLYYALTGKELEIKLAIPA